MILQISKRDIENAKKNFIKKQIGDGKKGPFYNGKQTSWTFNISDKCLFEDAVWQGYLDASRTFHNIKNTKVDKTAFHNLAKAIKDYFADNRAIFDHNMWCNNFIKDVSKHNHYSVRYGQAQKVVNMTFKYLYCCKGSEKYESHFNKCHMPLDQYTLAWLCTEGEFLYLEWSWFTEESYEKASKAALRVLGNDPLGKELVIWETFKTKVVNLKESYNVQCK